MQHDLTLKTRKSFEIFYARGGRWSFHTAKTHSCRRPFKFVASRDPLFDHLVGERVQLERAFENERLRGLDINFTPV